MRNAVMVRNTRRRCGKRKVRLEEGATYIGFVVLVSHRCMQLKEGIVGNKLERQASFRPQHFRERSLLSKQSVLI